MCKISSRDENVLRWVITESWPLSGWMD